MAGVDWGARRAPQSQLQRPDAMEATGKLECFSQEGLLRWKFGIVTHALDSR